MFSTQAGNSIDTLSAAGAVNLEAAKAKLNAEGCDFNEILAGAKRIQKNAVEALKGESTGEATEPDSHVMAQLREVAQSFEAYIVNMLMKKMRGEESGNKLFGNSPGNRAFSEMRDETYSKEIAKRGALGIADMIMDQYGAQTERFAAMNAGRQAGEE